MSATEENKVEEGQLGDGMLPRTVHGRLPALERGRDEFTVNYYLFVIAWSSMYQQLIEHLGEDGRKIARRAAEHMGYKWGEAMLALTQRDRDDATAAEIAKAYSESMQFFGYDNTIVESSDTRAVIRVTKCPLLEHWKRQYPDLIPHVCYVEPYVDVGSFRHINPKVRLDIPCKLSEGSPHSDYVITIEDGSQDLGPTLFDSGREVFEQYLAARTTLLSDTAGDDQQAPQGD
ncbi:MAG: L-2-amino-thiazoline-4-carboxylic acid hydrolase [Solirubrobacteraceae bacterium]